MKKIYILLLLLIIGVSKNYGQRNLNVKVTENDINISQDLNNMNLNIVYSSKELSNLQIKIKDEKGETIYTEEILERKNEHKRRIDLSAQCSGVYFVEVNSKSINQVERVELTETDQNKIIYSYTK